MALIQENKFLLLEQQIGQIIDPAIKRPGRLDQVIFVDLPDFPARVSIFEACLRKSPLDPDVNIPHLAEHTNGYSGADIGGICKVSAKIAIRKQIEISVIKIKAKEKAREEATKQDLEYMSEDEEDEVPTITMHMMLTALNDSQRSVTEQMYKKYIDMKELFERDNHSLNSVDVNQNKNINRDSNNLSEKLDLDINDEENNDDIYV